MLRADFHRQNHALPAISMPSRGGKAPSGRVDFFVESSDSSFELVADRAFYADPEKQYFIEIWGDLADLVMKPDHSSEGGG